MSNSSGMNFYERSAATLSLQVPMKTCWVVLCVAGIALNGFLMYVMLSVRHFRTIRYILILVTFMNDFVLAVCWAVSGVKTLYLGLVNLPETDTQFQCMLWMFSTSVSLFSSNFMALCIGVDRMLAISIPHWYKVNNRRMKLIMVSFVPPLAIGLTALGLAEADHSLLVVTCSGSFPPRYGQLTNVSQNVIICAVIFCSAVTGAVLLKRHRKHVQLRSTIASFKREIELHYLSRIAVLIAIFLLTQGAGSLSSYVIKTFLTNDSLRSALSPISGCMYVLRTLLDCITYIWFCQEYRDASKIVIVRWCCRKQTEQIQIRIQSGAIASVSGQLLFDTRNGLH